MGYMHIDNLYKSQDILMFKECYAMEKIHGTSAHISWKAGEVFEDLHELGENKQDGKVSFSSGGSKHETFKALFDEYRLKDRFEMSGLEEVTIYGEAYGGKLQGMSGTYGKALKFVVFDVKIGQCWLDVPKAELFANGLGLEFVAYERITTNLESIDKERDRLSRQAKRNGIIEDKIVEGVVLRPIIELRKNNGSRIMCKHKRDEFKETNTPRTVDPEKLKVIEGAKAIADEWVTVMRLNHILEKIQNPPMENMGAIIKTMIADVKREAEGEIVWSKAVEKQIGKSTAGMVKQYFNNKLRSK